MGFGLRRVRTMVARMDWVMLGSVLALCAFGIHMVRVATRDDITGDPEFFFTRQLIFMAVGLGLMAAAMAVDLEAISERPFLVWGVLIASVAVVLAIGQSVRGSSRWIDLGFFQFQPSEIGKIAMVLILAGLVQQRWRSIESPELSLFVVGVALVPTLIVFLQPDLGTSLVYMSILVGVLFFAGVPGRFFAWAIGFIAILAVLAVWVLPAVGITVLHDYQINRLTSFIDSNADPNETGFQTRQARTAVGHGGATGTGVEGATQVRNNLLPEHHTDFIFASTAEMYGFVGVTLLMLVFGVFIWRILRLVSRAPTLFEQLVAGGLATMFAFQVFVNIGMNVTIMPITGIPLPFLSYGGSHTLTNLIAVGILLRIYRRSVIASV